MDVAVHPLRRQQQHRGQRPRAREPDEARQLERSPQRQRNLERQPAQGFGDLREQRRIQEGVGRVAATVGVQAVEADRPVGVEVDAVAELAEQPADGDDRGDEDGGVGEDGASAQLGKNPY
jgi:hypothetical protein